MLSRVRDGALSHARLRRSGTFGGGCRNDIERAQRANGAQELTDVAERGRPERRICRAFALATIDEPN